MAKEFIAVAPSAPEPDRENSLPFMLKAEDVAKLCNVSLSALYKLVKIGRIPSSVSIGGSSRWHRDKFLAWLNKGCPWPKASN